MESEISSEGFDPLLFGECAQRLGAAKSRALCGELRSQDDSILNSHGSHRALQSPHGRRQTKIPVLSRGSSDLFGGSVTPERRLPVCGAPMTDVLDDDFSRGVVDGVDDAIVPHSKPVQVLGSSELD